MSTAPIPGPRPGATPGPRPGSVPRHPAATPLVKSNPADWGNIAADGTVTVKTATGERQIGIWQAGTAAEGLAHYGKRFDDLVTEVSLLKSRMHTHPDEAATIRSQAETLQGQLDTYQAIGDFGALAEALATIIADSHTVETQAAEARAARRREAMAKRTALVEEAEEIGANSSDWKAAGDRLAAIVEEWRQIRGGDRKTADQLWHRLSVARDQFNHRRGAHFATLDRNRATARRAKESIVERAQALKDSTDWAETSRKFHDLMDEWKAAGRAGRDLDDKLWAAFNAARNTFFDARSAVAKARDEAEEQNAKLKEELLEKYDQLIDPVADTIENARKYLHELQEKWEEVGFVPRARIRELEDRIRKIEARVAQAEEDAWRKSDPETQARAAAFAERAAELAAQAQAAQQAGKTSQAAKLQEQADQWAQWAKAAQEALDN